jgi:methionyl-tRNA formyltransferase
MKIFRAEKHPEKKSLKPGAIQIEKKSMEIGCQNGTLSLQEVQLENKKRMTIEDFILGFQTKKLLRAE